MAKTKWVYPGQNNKKWQIQEKQQKKKISRPKESN